LRCFVPLKNRLPLLVALVALLSLASTVPSEAQGRRGGRSRSVVIVGGGVYGGGYYYADPFWYGYPWYGYQYPPVYPPYRGYYRLDPGSAVRIEVTPKEAEVYVDGYYAGVVDDFDGVFQRLSLEPGDHDITLYRDGYRTVHQTIYLTPRSTFRIKYKMEPLPAGDVAEPRPTPPPNPPQAQGGPSQPGQPPPPGRGPVGRRQPPPPPNAPYPPNQRGARADVGAYGTLSIRVQPANATVLIDGERWDGPQGQDRLLVDVPEGNHRVEIQREGFEPYSTEIGVRRGETVPLNVSLRTR
jgi:hypothetical protein